MHNDIGGVRHEWRRIGGRWDWCLFRLDPWGLLERGAAASESEAIEAMNEALLRLRTLADFAGTPFREL